MSLYSEEECHCECHYIEHCYHLMACCIQCPICKANIKTFYYEEHVKNCREKFDKITQQIEQVLGSEPENP